MRQLVIGTAGHVDHGKTALIRALSGFEGDSTEEERKRGITIDLSFSNLTNEDTNISFIDVPGHEKLVKTMISGAFGFDAALIAIDAKEGVMPQTREHLEILNLLNIKNCVIALTKKDLVESVDNQKLLVEEHLKAYKNLHVKKIVPVSIYDKDSIELLKETLFSLPLVERPDKGVFRYYVDRSFSLKGIGTVVTGTVLEGTLEVGQKAWISELGTGAVVRNIQVHDSDVDVAKAGQRAALNLGKISHQNIKKGTLLTQKGYIRGFDEVDLHVKCLDDNSLPHNSTITLHAGAKQVEAKLLHMRPDEELKEGFTKAVLKEPMFLCYDEPFIISRSAHTVAGGKIVNAINDPIKKRQKLPLLEALHVKNFQEAFRLLSNIHKKGFGLISAYQRFGLSHEEALNLAKNMDEVYVDEKGLVIYPSSALNVLKDIVLGIYAKNSYALLSATSLSLKLVWASVGICQKVLDELDAKGFVSYKNGVYVKNGINIDDLDKHVEDKIYTILREEGNSPRAPYNIYDDLDCDRKTGDNALKKLTQAKKVIRLAHNLFVESSALTSMMEGLRNIIKTQGFVDVKNAKESFPLSRKYLISYLEYLDKFDDILKDGNRRMLK